MGTYAQCAKTNKHTGWGHTHNVQKRTNTQGGDIRTMLKTNKHTGWGHTHKCKNERTHTFFEPPEHYI